MLQQPGRLATLLLIWIFPLHFAAREAAGQVTVELVRPLKTYQAPEGIAEGKKIPVGTRLTVTGIHNNRWVATHKGKTVYLRLGTVHVVAPEETFEKLHALRDGIVAEYLAKVVAERQADLEQVALLEKTRQEAEGIQGPKGLRFIWVPTYTNGIDADDRPMSGLSPSGTEKVYVFWSSPKELVEWQLGQFGCVENICYGLGWQVDFGNPDEEFEAMMFFHEDRFYRYLVKTHSDDFDFIDKTLAKALGAATVSEDGTVQNRLGASFDQKIRTWRTDDVEIHLAKRTGKVDEGTLMVTYLPISEQIETLEGGEAPF